jgi:hypothetical protein
MKIEDKRNIQHELVKVYRKIADYKKIWLENEEECARLGEIVNKKERIIDELMKRIDGCVLKRDEAKAAMHFPAKWLKFSRKQLEMAEAEKELLLEQLKK